MDKEPFSVHPNFLRSAVLRREDSEIIISDAAHEEVERHFSDRRDHAHRPVTEPFTLRFFEKEGRIEAGSTIIC